MRTAAIISYCSYHEPFVRPLIEQTKKFVDGEVILVAFDKRFDGESEPPPPKGLDCKVIIETYQPDQTSRWHHNYQRKRGFDMLTDVYDSVFFFDADEVPVGDAMTNWMRDYDHKGKDYRFASYWYYRDTCWQARQLENSFAMVSWKSLENTVWFHEAEREVFSVQWHRLQTYQQEPLAHHYSWAGTKEMLLKKVKSWGHNQDRDWVAMLEEDFTHSFQGCPFRSEYQFHRVEPFIGFTFNE